MSTDSSRRTPLVKGGFLRLRVTAEDRHGNTVDSTLPRAVPVG
ncbi:hypothetical protein ACFYXW_18155 [Streptomyces sp. NPDC001981]